MPWPVNGEPPRGSQRTVRPACSAAPPLHRELTSTSTRGPAHGSRSVSIIGLQSVSGVPSLRDHSAPGSLRLDDQPAPGRSAPAQPARRAPARQPTRRGPAPSHAAPPEANKNGLRGTASTRYTRTSQWARSAASAAPTAASQPANESGRRSPRGGGAGGGGAESWDAVRAGALFPRRLYRRARSRLLPRVTNG